MAQRTTQIRNEVLTELLEGIDEGIVGLPEFQRDFEWSQDEVRDLLATLVVGWPIGALLVMDGKPTFFDVRAFEGAPPLQAVSRVRTVVLDGQQRLTSVYQALAGKGPRSYFIDLAVERSDKELFADAIGEIIRSMPAKNFLKKFPDSIAQAKGEIIPLTALRAPGEFYAWRDSFLSAGPDELGEFGRTATLAYQEQLSGLHNYLVPTVVLGADTEPAAVARIFERVNRTGQKLGAFDLMVAKTFVSKSFNLRQEWEVARDRYPVFEEFFPRDGLPILTLIALVLKSDVRERAVLDLSPSEVRVNWENACRAMDHALQVATSRYGVFSQSVVPYEVLLLILGGLHWDGARSVDESRIDRWYWWSVFSGRYDVASNTRAVADFKALTAINFTDDPSRTEVGAARFVGAIYQPIDELTILTAKSNRSLHRGIMTFVAAHQPLDPATGKPVFGLNGVTPQPSVNWVTCLETPTRDEALQTLGMVLTNAKKIHPENMKGTGLSSQFVDPTLIGDPANLSRKRLSTLSSVLYSEFQIELNLVEEEA